VEEHCLDGRRSGDESGVDCGGATCPDRCPTDGPCFINGDCESGVCIGGLCQAPSCFDGLQNGDETGRDCGGSCAAGCPLGSGCEEMDDCLAGRCVDMFCQAEHCFDDIANSGETDVDCGGTDCPPCAAGGMCVAPADCSSGSCIDGFCLTEECRNDAMDPGETGVDCGGPDCPGCEDMGVCEEDRDCLSRRCDDGTCGSCEDGMRNGPEAGVDCGVGCIGCASGTPCTDAEDCASRMCEGGFCTAEPESCLQIALADSSAESGVYSIRPEAGGEVQQVYCDMETDGGGWTLVGSTAMTTMDDAAGAYHDELRTLQPTMAHPTVWDGLRDTVGEDGDIRFACKTTPTAGTFTVDLSFYENNWYQVITEGADSATCFHPGSGTTTATEDPERRNNLTGETLPAGDVIGTSGIEGEDSCTDSGDFTVDFDAGGMDNTDSTDWGEDDSSTLCGSSVSGGAWFVFVRQNTCNNGTLDPGEAQIDCGGVCAGCPDGTACDEDSDCAGRCEGTMCTSCSDGVRSGPESDVDCGGDCLGCLGGERCVEDADCASRECDAMSCTDVPASCRELQLADGSAPSGTYMLQPIPGEPVRLVYCDMETDGGGWTLVGSTRAAAMNDQASTYYDDLATIDPVAGHDGIWDGLRAAAGDFADIRFSCRRSGASGTDVDMSFYRNNWYDVLTSSTDDTDVCFHPFVTADNDADVGVHRRNNLTGAEIPTGGMWADGSLEAEDSCTDTGDFTLDFTEGGMDRSEDTDWGEDDSSLQCGTGSASGGAWFVWVREPIPDLEVSVVPSETDCGSATLTVRNVGGMRFTSFELTTTIDGGTPMVETISMALDPGESFTRMETASVSVAASISATGDLNPGNDMDAAGLSVRGIASGYAEGFETGAGGWTVLGENPSWERGEPRGVFITSAAEGDNAFVTNLDGEYETDELSYLMSPCFDFSDLGADPTLSFGHIFRTEACCDESWVEISTNGGMTWRKLGSSATGTNWYNDGANGWWDGASGASGVWRTASHPLDGSAGMGEVRIRFVMSSDFSNEQDGVGVDTVEITP